MSLFIPFTLQVGSPYSMSASTRESSLGLSVRSIAGAIFGNFPFLEPPRKLPPVMDRWRTPREHGDVVAITWQTPTRQGSELWIKQLNGNLSGGGALRVTLVGSLLNIRSSRVPPWRHMFVSSTPGRNVIFKHSLPYSTNPFFRPVIVSKQCMGLVNMFFLEALISIFKSTACQAPTLTYASETRFRCRVWANWDGWLKDMKFLLQLSLKWMSKIAVALQPYTFVTLTDLTCDISFLPDPFKTHIHIGNMCQGLRLPVISSFPLWKVSGVVTTCLL